MHTSLSDTISFGSRPARPPSPGQNNATVLEKQNTIRNAELNDSPVTLPKANGTCSGFGRRRVFSS